MTTFKLFSHSLQELWDTVEMIASASAVYTVRHSILDSSVGRLLAPPEPSGVPLKPTAVTPGMKLRLAWRDNDFITLHHLENVRS